MSTVITHKQFPNHKTYKMDLCGRPLTIDVGKVAELATASAMVTYGETTVLVAVTASPRPRDGIDFFPLSVDFEEKLYAVGRIPGSFLRREGQPSLPAVLAARVIDRSIRPLFPYDFRNDVVVTCTVMSVDYDCSPELTAMIGVSACLAYSEIPWAGPIGCMEMGYVDGQIVKNPTQEQKHNSKLDLTVAATDGKVIMIEAGADQIPDDIMYDAILQAHEECRKQVAFLNTIVSEIGKEKMTYDHADFDYELFDKIVEATMDEAKAAMDTDDKNIREERWNKLIDHWHELFLEDYPEMDKYLEEITYKFQKKIVKAWLLEGHRVDGRAKNEIRPLAAEVGVLPRVHGSGLFTRGQTQVLSVCTLNTLSAAQKLDTIWEEEEKRYMHHYNFPAYSTGEARAARSVNRREKGHGALAERALEPVIPSAEEFPYAIRVVSEVLSSNGSTSQGSICGSTLALMDAGVPIKAPVAGISCGLIQDDDGGFTTFIDIQGVEDFHGEMDFKVAGTKAGITAIQMDIKNDGLSHAIIKEALEITRDARFAILDEIMLPCIAQPRAEVAETAPKMVKMKIDPDKIREVIGSGGKVIQKICADTRRQDRHRGRRHHLHRRGGQGLLRRRQEDHRDHRLRPRGGTALLRQGGAHPALRRLRGAGPRQGRHGPHLQALQPPGGEVRGRGEHRRHDLGQGHRDRRKGPGQPLLQGCPPGHRAQPRPQKVSLPCAGAPRGEKKQKNFSFCKTSGPCFGT